MHVTLVSYIVDEILKNFIELKEFVESLSKMAIVETAWEKFLESDSEVPPDVFFLVKGEDEGIGKDSSRTIGAHKNFLAGVSPVFRRMLFGPLKESKDVIEVKDTTFEAFNTMILYIYKRPNLPFFPAPFKRGDFMFRRAPTFESELFPTKTLVPKRSNSDKKQLGKYPLVFSESSVSFETEVSQQGVWPVNPSSEAEAEAEASRFVTPTRKQRIQCPQNFFDLLNLAEMYELESMKQELTGFVDVLDISDNNVMFTTRVAKSYQNIVAFEEVSIRLLANCLKFLLKRTDRGGDMWTRFWALINNSENSEVELRQCISLQEKLFGTPISISHAVLRKTVYQLDNLGTYDECLYLACSGVHVR